MPNLNFLAAPSDIPEVLAAVFTVPGIRVFEAYSTIGQALRAFDHPAEAARASSEPHLMIHAADSGPEPIIRRVDLNGGSHRWTADGWGLIQLVFTQSGRPGTLDGHSNHNTAKRAETWAPHYPNFGPPDAWDFAAVTRTSRRINAAIVKLAVTKQGSRWVLPGVRDAETEPSPAPAGAQ